MSELKIYSEGRFGSLFPKAFSFLQFYIPLKFPHMIVHKGAHKQPLPSIKVVVGHGLGKQSFAVYLEEFQGEHKVIFIDLANLLDVTQGRGGFNLDHLDLSKPSQLHALIRYLDAIPRFRSCLIHEYIHFAQHTGGGFDNMSQYPTAIKMNFHSQDMKGVAHAIMKDNPLREEVLEEMRTYNLAPHEIEARLAQWVYYIVEGYNKETIRMLDRTMFGKHGASDLKERMDNYAQHEHDLKKDLKKLRKKHITPSITAQIHQLHKEIKSYEKRKHRVHITLMYMFHMEKEAIRVAHLLKKRFHKIKA